MQIKRIIAIITIIVLMLAAGGCQDFSGINPITVPDTQASVEPLPTVPDAEPTKPKDGEPSMTVSVIDVGQGHSTLIESDGEYMLIDTSEAEFADTVLNYLADRGVKKLKYAIATHPHTDHMGGYPKILEAVKVENFIMPSKQNNTSTFEKMLQKLVDKNIPVIFPEAGKSYKLGSVKFTLLSPNGADYEDLNDWSVGTRFVCGDMSFIQTGDATTLSEKEMLGNKKLTLDSDVMLVPHHGSNSSSSEAFIKAVSPKIAIISVGKDNSYGHPKDKIVQRYIAAGAKVYRTDEVGCVRIDFSKSDYTVTSGGLPSDSVHTAAGGYIGNIATHKFHSPDCKNLPSKGNRIYFENYDEAIVAGYKPCGSCKPEK